MNKSLRTTERFSSKARGIWQTSTRMLLAVSLLSILSVAWGEPGPTNDVGILGTINHGPCSDTYEVDDTSANASTLTAGTPQQHNFDGNTFTGIYDKDWVKFQVVSEGVYTLTTSSLSSQTDTTIKLYSDPYGTELTSNDDAGGALGKGSQIVWSAPKGTSGLYYLSVTNSPNNTSFAFEDCGSTQVRYTLSLVSQVPSMKYLFLPLIMK